MISASEFCKGCPADFIIRPELLNWYGGNPMEDLCPVEHDPSNPRCLKHKEYLELLEEEKEDE